MTRPLKLVTLAALLATAAWSGIIKDPQMGLDSDSLSSPITSGTTITPVNGGGTFGFFNNSAHTITGLVFGTTMLTGISQDTIAANFFCNDRFTSALPNPFFTNCAVDYKPQTGQLTVSFFGVDPPGTGVGHRGIPPVSGGECELEPGHPPCTGHFRVTLNFDFATTSAAGGWSPDANPDFFATTPVFGVLEISTDAVPEPASFWLLGGGLAAVAWLRRRQKRFAGWK